MECGPLELRPHIAPEGFPGCSRSLENAFRPLSAVTTRNGTPLRRARYDMSLDIYWEGFNATFAEEAAAVAGASEVHRLPAAPSRRMIALVLAEIAPEEFTTGPGRNGNPSGLTNVL